MENLALQWADSSSLHSPQPGRRYRQEVTMFLNDHIQVRRNGTIRYHKQKTSIPSLLSKVGVSIVRDGSLSYIAGIHITSQEGRR